MSKQVPCWLLVCLFVGCNSSSSSDASPPPGDGSGKPAVEAAGTCDELLTCVCGGTEPTDDDTESCANMRALVAGYRTNYGHEAADAHCGVQQTLAGLTNCGGASTPGAPAEGELVGACDTGKGICIEHHASPNVPEGNGLSTCNINSGTWLPGMGCTLENLLGYCEDKLEKYGQTLYYYRNTTNNERTLRDACETGWHPGTGAGAGGASGSSGGSSGSAGKASSTGGKVATGGSASSAACEAISAFRTQIVDAVQELSGEFDACEKAADCQERSTVEVRCPNGLVVTLGMRAIARSSGNDFDAALQTIADEHCAEAPEPAACGGGGGIIPAHHLECEEQRCIFVYP